MLKNMENQTDKTSTSGVTVNSDRSDLSRKILDVNTNSKRIYTSREKCNFTQARDICDLTLSSFNDLLLGESSHLQDISIGDIGNDLIGRTSNTKHLTKNVNITSSDTFKTENFLKSDTFLVAKSDSEQYEYNVKSEQFNFYHVFEVLQNPSALVAKNNTQNKNIKTRAVTFKSHKNVKRKRKKGLNIGIKKGQRYLQNFKQKVLEYASNHSFKATALHFNVNCNTVTEWARESKRLSLQQKSTTIPASVYHFKTETVHPQATKTDIVLVNDRFTTETEYNQNVLKKIQQDLPLGDMQSDERFLKWIKNQRLEKKELSRDEVYYAAQYCIEKYENILSPDWFLMWINRYSRSLTNNKKSYIDTEKYIMYPSGFKLEVVLYAKLFSKNSAARVFNVPRRRIFDWFKYSDSLNNSNLICNEFVTLSNNCSGEVGLESGCNKEKVRREIDTKLHDWYQKRFSEGYSPSSKEIKAKAREIFTENGIMNLKFSEGWLQKFCKRLNIKLRHSGDNRLLLWILSQFDNNVSLSHQQITEKSSVLIGKQKHFKGSKGWTLRFLKRHSNFLQQVPTIKDKLPEIVQHDINEFCRNFKSVITSLKIQFNSIGCMDEIPIYFNYPRDSRNSSLPLLRKTGFENCQAIVFLCMLADGRLLPPAVVFRGKNGRQIFSTDGVDILILYQENGVIDFDTVESWVSDKWLSCVSSPSILLVDSFKPHGMPELQEKLARGRCLLSIIPEGCSSQLQPLDVEITPKFRESIKTQWEDFPSNEVPYSSKLDRKCRYPDQNIILQWIGKAYLEIKDYSYVVTNSFRVVGLVD